MSRATDRRRFLASQGWADAVVTRLTGDASNRSYVRLRRGDETAIVMDAPTATNPDTARFVEVAHYLHQVGLRPPRIMGQDLDQGFLLLEDLGDALFARVLEQQPELEARLYQVAAQVLLHLRRAPVLPGLTQFTPQVMTRITDLAYHWYAAEGATPPDHAPADAALLAALHQAAAKTDVVALRDFHAENLVWLPGAQGTDRAGLLDFQDAVLAHPAYDLVSLLQDARRDVSPKTRDNTIAAYLSQSGDDPDHFKAALAAIGAQRNLRILGVFARLALRAGKRHYVDMIHRVWQHLQYDLQHPILADLKTALASLLPAPTPDKLERLRRVCATIPAP